MLDTITEKVRQGHRLSAEEGLYLYSEAPIEPLSKLANEVREKRHGNRFIQRVDSMDAAIDSARETSYGLAASLLGGDADLFRRFVRDIGAGVVNWNRPTTGAAGALPFGGLGDSGNHRPAGFYAIDFIRR